MAKINGITVVYKDGVKYNFYDMSAFGTPSLGSSTNNSNSSSFNKENEDNLWKESSATFATLKDPNLNKTL